ncbi:MAG TPA: ABC transporter ATP-binding protein [Methylomirabilota bacterium]|nr:ABC transporter ATP-binding protein [Methylomirabilota bacterium]
MNSARPNAEARRSSPLLEARELHKTYTTGKRELTVLRGVNFSATRGEFVALQGASGAGKSTLLHLLGGLDRPNRGEIIFGGEDVSRLSNPSLAHLRNIKIGFVFQAYHLFPELNALENVFLPARMARVPVEDALRRGKQLLERVGLGERMEHRPTELSGGEQQRVAIARALVNNPEVILADEPTGNLDSHTGEEIMDLLLALRAEKQTTLIIATHDSRIAARAPRVVHLVDGQVA